MSCELLGKVSPSMRAPEKGSIGVQAEEHWLSLLESFPPLPVRGQGSCRTALGMDPSLEVKVEEH